MRSEINEHRSNCFAGKGLNAGVADGQLLLGAKDGTAGCRRPIEEYRAASLRGGERRGGHAHARGARARHGASLGKVTQDFPAEALLGNVALVSNYGAEGGKKGGQEGRRGRDRGIASSQWTMAGDAFTVGREQRFGPILWAMYSLSDSRTDEGFVMKISALTGPMGEDDNQGSNCMCRSDGAWHSLGEAKLDPDAWVATFRIPNWDETDGHSLQARLSREAPRRHGDAGRMDRHDPGESRGPSAAHGRDDLPERLRLSL